MAVSKETKAKALEEIKEKFRDAKSVVLLDYIGLTVEEVTSLRNKCRAADVDYKVYKNTLVNKAARELKIDGLEQYLKSTNAFAFSKTDAIAPAKVLSDFIKEVKKTKFRAGIVDGAVIDAKSVEQLASIPSREVLLARVMGSINSAVSSFVRTLDAIAKKKAEA